MIYIIIIAAVWLAWFLWKNREVSARAVPLSDCGISIRAIHPYGNDDYVRLEVESQKPYIRFDIAGTSYRGNLDAYIGEFDGTLEPEPSNPHDPTAVKVLHRNGRHIGYVPRNYDGDRVKARHQYPRPCRCYLMKIDGGYCGIGVVTALLVLLIVGCTNVKRVGPFDDGKAVCREKADTVIAHMRGWKELSSEYIADRFMTTTDKQTGERTEYYQYVMVATVCDGRDTLVVMTDNSTVGDRWDGCVHDRNVTFSENADVIKRHNLALKSACEGDTCFTISANGNHVLSAKFEKQKPKTPERPIEDYGLTEKDINQ